MITENQSEHFTGQAYRTLLSLLRHDSPTVKFPGEKARVQTQSMHVVADISHVCTPISPLSLHPCSILLCRYNNVSDSLLWMYTHDMGLANHALKSVNFRAVSQWKLPFLNDRSVHAFILYEIGSISLTVIFFTQSAVFNVCISVKMDIRDTGK